MEKAASTEIFPWRVAKVVKTKKKMICDRNQEEDDM